MAFNGVWLTECNDIAAERADQGQIERTYRLISLYTLREINPGLRPVG